MLYFSKSVVPPASSMPTTPQSTQAKRSLLARAIKNNMAQLSISLFNTGGTGAGGGAVNAASSALNRSTDDVSMLSNNCASSDVSINTDVSIDNEFDVLNESSVSELSSDRTPDSSPSRPQIRPFDADMDESMFDTSKCLLLLAYF